MLRNIAKTTLVAASFVVALGVMNSSAQAVVLLETATFRPIEDGGFTLYAGQFAGARLEVSQTTLIDHIGGNFGNSVGRGGNEMIFGAIVPLNANHLPSGTSGDLGTSAVAHATFSVAANGDVLVPISATLAPGEYGIVFGSGLFGATGQSFMGWENLLTPQASLFNYYNGWYDAPAYGNPNGHRFVVEGSQVPEPASLTLLLAGLATMLIWGRLTGIMAR